MAYDAGTIEVKATLDTSAYTHGLREMRAQAEYAEHRGIHIKADVDNAGARRALSEVDQDVQKVGKSAETSRKKVKGGEGGSVGLVDAIALLGPAAVPIVAAAVPAILGLGAAAGVAVVGFLGIRDEMKQGTTIGQQYTAGVNTLKQEFTTLKQVSSSGLLTGFQTGIAALHGAFPLVNQDVAGFSVQLGMIVSHLVPGFVALLTRANPLITQLGDYLIKGSKAFENWATNSQGFGKFIEYAQANLPKVLEALGALSTALVHIAAAMAPLGGVALDGIIKLSNAIASLPLPVLEALLITFQASRLVTIGKALAGMAESLEKVGGAGEKFGEVLSKIGLVGAIVIGGTLALSAAATTLGYGINGVYQQVNDNAKSTGEQMTAIAGSAKTLEGAITRDGDSIGYYTQQVVLATLGSENFKNEMAGLGLSSSTVATALTGTTDQYNKFIAALEKKTGLTGQDDFIKELDAERQAILDAKDAADQKRLATIAMATVDEYGSTAAYTAATAQDDLSTALAGADKSAADQVIQQEAARIALYASADAAGILKDQLDRLNGKELSAAEALNAFDGDLLKFTSTVNNAKKAGDKNATSLDNNTEAGNKNVKNLLKLITANNEYAQRLTNTAGPTGGIANGIKALNHLDDQTRAAAYAAGFNKQEVDKMIASLHKIPTVAKTKVQVEAAKAKIEIASVRAALKALDGTYATAYAYVQTLHLDASRGSTGDAHPGTLTGSSYTGTASGGTPSADGGLYKYYASGGLENHVAQIARNLPGNTVRVWAEPETEGESYIPLALNKRPRAEAVLAETARLFNGEFRRFADGGRSVSGPIASDATDTRDPLLNETRALRRDMRELINATREQPQVAARLKLIQQRTH